MLVNAETAQHRFCARILGWTADREVSVEHAIRSIELATDHRAALVLLAAAAELPTPGGFMSQLNIDRTSLETVLAYAASAARLVGHIDYGTVPSRALLDLIDDNIDKVAHKLCELLGNPHLIEDREPLTTSSRASTASSTAPRGAHHRVLLGDVQHERGADLEHGARERHGRAAVPPVLGIEGAHGRASASGRGCRRRDRRAAHRRRAGPRARGRCPGRRAELVRFAHRAACSPRWSSLIGATCSASRPRSARRTSDPRAWLRPR
jgi:hypothetical protein